MAEVPRLTIQGVGKSFGGTRALNDVSLSVAVGEVLAIIGPNGAGKSTLLHIVAGQTKPDSGSCEFAGRCLTAAPMHVNARHGVVQAFQDPRLFGNLSVEENVLAACGDRAETTRQLARFGLKDLTRAKARDLSYGQQKLVAFARALAARPRLLLLDEPTAGLEKNVLPLLTTLVQELRERAAVVIVEHDINFVRGVADHIAVLQGTVVAHGERARVLDDRDVVQTYLGRLYT